MLPVLSADRLSLNQAEIMSRVMFICRLKRVASSQITKLCLVIVFGTTELLSISLGDVWANLTSTDNMTDGSLFLLRAAAGTDLIVQLSFVGLVFFSYLLLRNQFNFGFRRLVNFWRWRPVRTA